MTSSLIGISIKDQILQLLQEDDLSRNIYYTGKLSDRLVRCTLKVKDDLRLSGLPFFMSVFETLYKENINWNQLEKNEGKDFSKNEKAEFSFDLPLSVAITGERLALNLLARSSAISTYTQKFVKAVEGKDIVILDTRKTTPGLRWLEKYAIRLGGGHNHRFGQADVWMIKDNHKTLLGGLEGAWKFFKEMNDFYRPIVVEIHDLKELEMAFKLGAAHLMLDNFSIENIHKAISMKPKTVTYEVSGGISLPTIKDFSIQGIDAMSVGSLTYGAPPVDLSLKMKLP